MSDESIVDLVRKHQAQGGMPLPQASPEERHNAPESAAVERKAAAMSENLPTDTATEEALQKLLEKVSPKMTWTEIRLPSEGLLYENGQRTIQIRPFTFDDERILKSMQAVKNPEAVIESLLRNCVRGIEVSKLTPADKMYTLFRLRGLSYGDEYPIQHDCESCETTSKLNLSISTLEIIPLKEEDMIFTLPDSEQEVRIKLPRTEDEHLFRTPEQMMENLSMFVYSVGGIIDKTIIDAFLRKTTVRDIDTIRQRVFNPSYGMERFFFYACNNCNHKNKVNIVINESFFTAS